MTWLDTVMDFSSPRMSYEKNDLMQLRDGSRTSDGGYCVVRSGDEFRRQF